MKIFLIGGLVSDSISDPAIAAQTLKSACSEFGTRLADAGHEVVLCSPFEDSADFHVLCGMTVNAKANQRPVAFHFVDMPIVRKKLETLIGDLGLTRVSRIPYPPAQSESRQALRYAWLLCQLGALDSSHAVIAIGGEADGAANMLLQLADARRKPVLPWPFMGGAAQLAFERKRYELHDRLGPEVEMLHDEASTACVSKLIETLAQGGAGSMRPAEKIPGVFISYARERQTEADFVETLLRRRNLQVFRDDSHFGAGHSIPEQIRQAIFRSDIFVALWSAEYACSPWCADEMEFALDRRESGALDLWILRLDQTRIVPRRARELLFHEAPDRAQMEARIKGLLERITVSADE